MIELQPHLTGTVHPTVRPPDPINLTGKPGVPNHSRLSNPLPWRLRRTADLARNRHYRRPLRTILPGVPKNEPHCPLSYLLRIPALSCHGPILSTYGASGNPGAIQYGGPTGIRSPPGTGRESLMSIVGACDHGAVQRRQSLLEATIYNKPRFMRMSFLHCWHLLEASGGPMGIRSPPLTGSGQSIACLWGNAL